MIDDTIKLIQDSITEDLDKSKYGPYYNLFIVPAAQIIDPLESRITKIENFQGLRDSDLLSDEEVDKIASNFLIFRNEGSAGKCKFKVVTKQKKDVTIARSALITATINDSTYSFTFEGATIAATNFQQNGTYGKYYISTLTINAYTGTESHVDYNAIPRNTVIPTTSGIDDNIVFFILDSFIEPTVAREDNLSFYSRLLNTAGNKNLESETGIRNLFSEYFPDVPIVAVYGNVDQEVSRNQVTVYSQANDNDYVSLNFKGKLEGNDSIPHKAYEYLLTSNPDEYTLYGERLIPGPFYLFNSLEASQEDYDGLQSRFSPHYFISGFNIILSSDNAKVFDNWVASDEFKGAGEMLSSNEIIPIENGFRLGTSISEIDYQSFIKELLA